jgi:aryl-alcohol dehydrogenase-like predicted oxidoreductase
LSRIERRDVAPGYSIARVINGGWQLAADHDATTEGRSPDRDLTERGRVVGDLVRLAEAGFTTFDCADIYAGVEELYAELVRCWRSFGRPIEDLQIHTKYVPDRSSLADLDRRAIARAVNRSLDRLGVEQLDLVQFHWWDFEVAGWFEAAATLAELRAAGKIREVGVTNFDCRRLRALLEGGIPVAAHQVQYSLLDRRPERGMVELCASHGVALLCYGTLAGGLLTERWLGAEPPIPGEEANRSVTKYRLIVEEAGGWQAFQGLLGALARVAGRRQASVANVATRWVLDRPGVTAAIVGAASADHLEENAHLFDLELDEQDRGELETALALCRSPAGDTYELEREPGGRHGAILRTELHGDS